MKEVLATEYKEPWYEAISGRWKGKFGDRVIELTIKANERGIKGHSKFAGQGNDKQVEFRGEKTHDQESGQNVTFTMEEQPADKEWNGVFRCRMERETGEIEGRWRSNNGKLERRFTLKRERE